MAGTRYTKVESGYEPDTPTADDSTAAASRPRLGDDGHGRPRASVVRAAFPWALSAVLAVALAVQTTAASRYLDPAGLPPKCAEHHQERYSPAYEAIKYHDVTFYRAFGDNETAHHLSPYQGWPTDEKDRLWEDMYAKGILIGIGSASHSKLLNSSERVPAEGQTGRYMVGIDVFHQLHCLDALRRSLYPRRYNSTLASRAGGDEVEVEVDYGRWMHLDHCVEALRQSLTCSADVAAYSYEWLDDAKLMMARVGGLHRCRDFRAIQDWAFAKHVDPGSMRARVEDVDGGGGGGVRIVDYSDHFDYRTKPWKPPGWRHTVDEL